MDYISIKNGSAVIYLKTSEIISVFSANRKLTINSSAGSYEVYGKISEFCLMLPKSFKQCHKSCIINLDKVNKIISWSSMEMSDGSVVPISRTYKDNIKSAGTIANT